MVNAPVAWVADRDAKVVVSLDEGLYARARVPLEGWPTSVGSDGRGGAWVAVHHWVHPM